MIAVVINVINDEIECILEDVETIRYDDNYIILENIYNETKRFRRLIHKLHVH